MTEAALREGNEEPLAPEDVDDQFRSLMEGLRTTIPGVMVLFSFLLVLPLQSSFPEISDVNALIFYVAFGSAALASVLLIAPSVHQRVRAPKTGIRRTTWSHVMVAAKLTIAGSVAFLVAVAAVVYLVSSLVFSDVVAVVASAIITITAAWAWFYLPTVGFDRDD